MLKLRGFGQLKAWTHGVDTELFAYRAEPQVMQEWAHWPRPYWLFVGRISYEKNIEAFLALDLPGTKIVCGVGPLEASLRSRYPEVLWMGVLPRARLAQVYGACDVFVFPSRNETFGLVMLEALSTGTPVAAYPVDGPLQVLGQDQGLPQGGVLGGDLREAALQALNISRAQARARAMAFGWRETVTRFVSHLVPVSTHQAAALSRICHFQASESAAELAS